MKKLGGRLLVALLWLLHWLPLGRPAGGVGLPARLGAVAPCPRPPRGGAAQPGALPAGFAQPAVRESLARDHLRWLGRSLLERALLWYASPTRLKRLIHLDGDVHYHLDFKST